MELANANFVSVIIPVYNGSRFIIDALNSVKGQTHRQLECIVVDDGSTDNTADIVKEWIISDNRFIYLFQNNKGLSGARNKGLDHAKGNYIQFLDADDILLPGKIEKQLKDNTDRDPIMVSYTDYSSGTSDDIFIPANFHTAAKFNSTDPLHELITRWESSLVIPPHCFLFSSSFFREKGIRFDTSLPNHEDFDCWLTIFRLQPPVRYVDEKLCVYRITEGSMSKNMKLMCEGFLKVLEKHIRLPDQPAIVKKLLIRKRREVLKGYSRFDMMTFREKIIMIRHVLAYYQKRILQKCGLIK